MRERELEEKSVRVVGSWLRVESWLVRVAFFLVLRGGVKRDVGDTRGAVVCSRSCVVVLVEAKGPRGTRCRREARVQCPSPEGLEAAVAKQDGKCQRGFADQRKGSRDSLSFLFIGVCVYARGRRLVW